MSMHLFAALALASVIAVLTAAGCGNSSKDACDPEKCAPVKCPEGDRRGCIYDACVTDVKTLCVGET